MPKDKKDEVLKCSFCRGWGTVRGKLCPACGGVGKFLAPPKWVECAACRGWGHMHGSREPCPACGGKGKVRPKKL